MSPEMAQAFEAYKKYLAIKSHFTQPSYDYFKYSGKVRATFTSFETRKDKYFFYKLSKQKNLEAFLVSSFVDGEGNHWIGDLMENMVVNETYTKWLKRQESLTYVFTGDLEKLDDDYNANLTVNQGQHPLLLTTYLQKNVCIETLIILNKLSGYAVHWNKQIVDPVVWPSVYNKMVKYQPFVKFDAIKCREIVKNRFLNNINNERGSNGRTTSSRRRIHSQTE